MSNLDQGALPVTDRIRIPTDLATKVHRYGLQDGRSFDGAARRLLELGLEAAPERLTFQNFVELVARAKGDAAKLAAAAQKHCLDPDVRAAPELHGFIAAIGTTMTDLAINAGAALAALPERHRH
jgi:hypothetical protein